MRTNIRILILYYLMITVFLILFNHIGGRKTMVHKKMRTAESEPNLLNRIHFAINRLGYSKRDLRGHSR